MQATIEQIDPTKPLIVSTPETAMALFDPITVGLAKIQEFKSISLEVNGIARVTECRIAAKKARCAVTNRQKELTEGAKKYQKDVESAAKKIIGQIEPVETYLEGEEAKHQRILDEERKKEEARKAAILQERCDRLAKAGCAAGNLVALGNMTDELFEWHLKDQAEKAETARVKAEQERIERERVQREEQERRIKEDAERAAAIAIENQKREAAEKAEQERLKQIELSRPKVAQKTEPLIPLEPNVVAIPAPPIGEPSPFQSIYSRRNQVFFPTSIVDRLKYSEQLARANGKSGVADLFRDAMNEIVSIKEAAAKVVHAMNHQGEDGWERLKAAVVELSGFTD